MYLPGMPKLVYVDHVNRERIRTHSISARISDETREMLRRLEQLEPRVRQSRAVEEGIRLVAERHGIAVPAKHV